MQHRQVDAQVWAPPQQEFGRFRVPQTASSQEMWPTDIVAASCSVFWLPGPSSQAVANPDREVAIRAIKMMERRNMKNKLFIPNFRMSTRGREHLSRNIGLLVCGNVPDLLFCPV